MKFKLHGHSSPDPKRSRVPSLVRSGSAARITFQLHTHIYIECEAPLQHHKTTDNDNNYICVTIHITTLGMFRGGGGGSDPKNQERKKIFLCKSTTNIGGGGGGGGGGGVSHKYQSLWSFTQKIMEYQWVYCPLSSTHPLPHPLDSSSSVPAFSDREDVQNSEQEEPLPILHHWNLLPLRLFHHQVRHLLLHHWNTLLLLPHLRPIHNWVGDCIHMWSSTCGKKF